MGKIKWNDWALLPFRLCVRFLQGLGKLCGMTYKQISVVFNLWIQGGVLMLSGIAPFCIATFKMPEPCSMGWGVLTIILGVYGLAYLYAFIKMLQHYHLPFDDAFDLCVKDLELYANKWHTTYERVNLLFFVEFYLLLLVLNVFICLYLLFWM